MVNKETTKLSKADKKLNDLARQGLKYSDKETLIFLNNAYQVLLHRLEISPKLQSKYVEAIQLLGDAFVKDLAEDAIVNGPLTWRDVPLLLVLAALKVECKLNCKMPDMPFGQIKLGEF